MKLSVIIVNYNVEYFLEQCLHSVFTALEGIESEVFVVDNHSVDGSVRMLKKKFPQVHLIVNQENVGFAKANNQAMRHAKGKYILLLNPDTLVEADTFVKILAFMDETPLAGGLGVKMVNGEGSFLPESKRGLPLPSVAFYKIFGLSKVFKKSRRFGKYHLTYLDRDEINEVEVLSGAFMLLRKSVLDKIGYLDEDYFMYGEDIDLSYRILLSGHKNYYFPKTRIIHYKGESTKKSSINYVLVFYKAMQIFAKKHFSQKNAKLFHTMINLAIWFRASLSIFKRLVLKIIVPLLDFILICGGLLIIAHYWEKWILLPKGSGFPEEFLFIVLPIYTIIWVLSIYFSNAYKQPVKLENLGKGILTGTVIILLIYSLLSENLRFSRAIIVLGTLWVLVASYAFRYFLGRLHLPNYPVGRKRPKRVLIIGDINEAKRISILLGTTPVQNEFVGYINHIKNNEEYKSDEYIGNLSQLKDIISIYKINELIFCGENLPAKEIINIMSELEEWSLEYKIAPSQSTYIIGSNSISVFGDLYTLHVNSIGKKVNLQKKRMFDIVVSWLLLILFPIFIGFVNRKSMFFRNIMMVLAGKKTWVGYNPLSNKSMSTLPPLRKAVLFSTDILRLEQNNEDLIYQVNNIYAQDYKLTTDMQIILKAFKHLGR
ncbi:MAG: glycosyltransferase [Bacteroidales bacterium]|jgi:GT2 family glycosyltransferase|nr:glycosyltransferase [Bacteroidales bacterium]MDD3329715.1 glycosyltransferase [Bacteroidales bacterium]MDD3690495.1 glycosyltransferase [Bacteroidales bacterium]MDD4045330.1 glycosyltransferase [Bacteroidales bacterium]MDD4581377.1 glycosyltransferase [Bacteroidales bacterium]